MLGAGPRPIAAPAAGRRDHATRRRRSRARCAVALPRALGLRRLAHAAPRIVVLDLGYAVKGRPVGLVIGRYRVMVVLRMVSRGVLGRQLPKRPRALGTSGDRQQRHGRHGRHDQPHRHPSELDRTKSPAIKQSRAVWARALVLASCGWDQKCAPIPTKPTQMLLLVLHDSLALIAQPTLSFSERTKLLLIRSYHWKPPFTYQPP